MAFVYTVVPAYGKRYANDAEIVSAWEAGKDFQIVDGNSGRWNGRYCSIRDTAVMKAEGCDCVWLQQPSGKYVGAKVAL